MVAPAFTFANGFFGSVTSTGASSTSGVGFVGLYTTAILANGLNVDVLPVGVGWPGTLANPYGRVDFTGGGAGTTVAGLVGGLDGQIAVGRNTTGSDMTLLDQSGLEATPANRFAIGADLFLLDGQSVTLVYYAGAVNRWVVQSI